MPTLIEQFQGALRASAGEFGIQLSEDDIRRLSNYYELLLKWNDRLHLIAPCPPGEFATRHILESLTLLQFLPRHASIADVGSGAGLPIIPNLIVRNDLHAKIIEASAKKGVFLREALRATDTSGQAEVIAERFENLPTPDTAYVTCRALDRLNRVFPKLVRWSPANSTLLLFGGGALYEQLQNAGLKFSSVTMPRSERRFLFAIIPEPES